MSPSGDVGGGGEISGGIWARERGNTAHIPPGEQKLEEDKVGRKGFFYMKLFCQIYLAGGFAGSLIVHQNIATLGLRLSVTDKES